jgi:hypothetical protein
VSVGLLRVHKEQAMSGRSLGEDPCSEGLSEAAVASLGLVVCDGVSDDQRGVARLMLRDGWRQFFGTWLDDLRCCGRPMLFMVKGRELAVVTCEGVIYRGPSLARFLNLL